VAEAGQIRSLDLVVPKLWVLIFRITVYEEEAARIQSHCHCQPFTQNTRSLVEPPKIGPSDLDLGSSKLAYQPL
jgi:hypothetical protein